MPSLDIHLAIAKRYVDKNIVVDVISFNKGSLDPDFAQKHRISHYSGERNNNDLISSLKNKVILNEYLKTNSIDTDYDRGVFLHLIADYIFFNDFFDKDYLNEMNYNDFRQDLYYSYRKNVLYLKEKYLIDSLELDVYSKNKIDETIKKSINGKKITDERTPNNILPFAKIDKFVEYISNINLLNYREKLLNYGVNVLP